MNSIVFYQWQIEIRKHFSTLNKWQALGLALLSYGIIKSRHAQVSIIAEELPEFGKASTVERRIQRWIANRLIVVDDACVFFARWVLHRYRGKRIFLLVDETKISDRIACMMLSLAIHNRAIPLLWRCYRANSAEEYPSEGQVKMIGKMLRKLKPILPTDKEALVEADRGIGNSSNLMREVSESGFFFLFRVKDTAIFTSAERTSSSLKSLAEHGKDWHETGSLFTLHRAVECNVHVLWEEKHSEAWALATNLPGLSGEEYKMRVWQEESFRDLKSAGWQWHSSLLRNPVIAERILLAMALAYAWMVSLGLYFQNTEKETRQGVDCLRKHTKYSFFRKGLRFLKRYLYAAPENIPVSIGPFSEPRIHA